MTGGEVKDGGKESKERPALPVAGYEPPSWAGKAAPGLHLDVLKVLAAMPLIMMALPVYLQQEDHEFCRMGN